MPAPLTFATLTPDATAPPPPRRFTSGFRVFDDVLGSGFVPGSTLLVAGDPGAGKSTLLLQVAARVACASLPVAYVTAEEAAPQVQSRAARLGVARAPVVLASTSDLASVIAELRNRAPTPKLVVFDSIQGFSPVPSHAVPLLRKIVEFAQTTRAVALVVCHVTKSRAAAGPNTLQHDVDAVLRLVTEPATPDRTLFATKNRFGPTDVTGRLTMTQKGFVE